ncbi:MAG: DUF5668 domain-containing protein [Bryobacteraceae bacterium]
MNPLAAYVRAIRGPIVLIVLGILMLIDHFGDISFWRTWPTLLIVFGVMVLVERAFGKPTGPNSNLPGDIRL